MKICLTKNLEPLRASALARLDALVAEKIADETPPAIAALRSTKAREAVLFLVSGRDRDLTPLLTAESTALGVPLLDLVKTVLVKVAEVGDGLAAIEAQRQRAQAAIRSASHPAAIDAALEEILNGWASATSGDWAGPTSMGGPAGANGTAGLVGTSATSLAVGLGPKTLVATTARDWSVGSRLRIASTDASKWMDGDVAAYDAGTGDLTVTVEVSSGSGTASSWNISLVGARGATGSAGAAIGGILTARGDIAFHNGTSVVRLPAGTAGQVLRTGGASADPSWGASVGARETLTAARTYYVRTDGSDSNSGLTNTSGGAFLTIPKAVQAAYALDTAGFSVTISVGAGTYTSGIVINRNLVGGGTLIIAGAGATTTINTTSATCVLLNNGAAVTVKNLKVQTAISGHGFFVLNGSRLIHEGLDFGSVAENHVDVTAGGLVYCASNYTISGGAGGWHIHAHEMGSINHSLNTVTLSGTPVFAAGFAGCAWSFIQLYSVTYIGSATGYRYLAHKNGVIDTNGGGESYLPGSLSGGVVTGGVYA